MPVPARDGDEVEASAKHADAVLGSWHPPHELAGQIHDVDVVIMVVVAMSEHKERLPVAGPVGSDEGPVVGEGPPGGADGAEAAELLS